MFVEKWMTVAADQRCCLQIWAAAKTAAEVTAEVAVEIPAEVLVEVTVEALAEAAADIAAEIAAEVLVELAGGTELEARVEIRQPEELKVFDSLRLFVVVAAEVLIKL